MDTVVKRVRRVRGRLALPGDKSIAHRALILGAMAAGQQSVEQLPASEDVAATVSCLETLGCRTEKKGSSSVLISPGEWAAGSTVFARNSGTTARLLSGLIAGKGLDVGIDGDASLRKRPMARIAQPLGRMGATITLSPGDRLPMRIRGGDLRGITWQPPVPSAQVKSAILIAGLCAEGRTEVIEALATRDHTERMLAAMGVPVERKGNAIAVPGRATLQGISITVPGDVSSAYFFMAAAAMIPGSSVRLLDVGINPTRLGALNVLKRMGAAITLETKESRAGEPLADIVVDPGSLKGATIEAAEVPSLIDELPVLAVVATQAEGTFEVRGAGELRHKESDRIDEIVRNLSLLGADIEEYDDGFAVQGPTALKSAAVSSGGDHRIAMALAVAGLATEGGVKIGNSEAVAVSYPDFFHDLHSLCE